jgi:hypothetical protein
MEAKTAADARDAPAERPSWSSSARVTGRPTRASDAPELGTVVAAAEAIERHGRAMAALGGRLRARSAGSLAAPIGEHWCADGAGLVRLADELRAMVGQPRRLARTLPVRGSALADHGAVMLEMLDALAGEPDRDDVQTELRRQCEALVDAGRHLARLGRGARAPARR